MKDGLFNLRNSAGKGSNVNYACAPTSFIYTKHAYMYNMSEEAICLF